jgi:hypothetical protein
VGSATFGNHRSGALGQMGYAEVKRYADVYVRQQELMRLWERLSDQLGAVLPILESGVVKLSLSDLQNTRGSLLAAKETVRVARRDRARRCFFRRLVVIWRFGRAFGRATFVFVFAFFLIGWHLVAGLRSLRLRRRYGQVVRGEAAGPSIDGVAWASHPLR